MIYHFYPDKLEQFIREEGHEYIPRRLRKSEHLRLFRRYYRTYTNDCIKVYQIYYANNIEYYSVKYIDMMLGEITYPLNEDDTYELMKDKNDIAHKDNIINDDNKYTGAEIRYWFFVGNRLENPMYERFISYILPYSQNSICDNKTYYIKASLIDKKYTDCKLISTSSSKR